MNPNWIYITKEQRTATIEKLAEHNIRYGIDYKVVAVALNSSIETTPALMFFTPKMLVAAKMVL